MVSLGPSSMWSLPVSSAAAASARLEGCGGSGVVFLLDLVGEGEELHVRHRREEQFQRPWLMLEEKSFLQG